MMLTRAEFETLMNKVINGGTISEEELDRVIFMLNYARLTPFYYEKNTSMTPTQNLLDIMRQKMVQFYQSVLGE